MELLDLEPEHVGTLMRLHGVGGFGYDRISEERLRSLIRALSAEEWARVAEFR